MTPSISSALRLSEDTARAAGSALNVKRNDNVKIVGKFNPTVFYITEERESLSFSLIDEIIPKHLLRLTLAQSGFLLLKKILSSLSSSSKLLQASPLIKKPMAILFLFQYISILSSFSSAEAMFSSVRETYKASRLSSSVFSLFSTKPKESVLKRIAKARINTADKTLFILSLLSYYVDVTVDVGGHKQYIADFKLLFLENILNFFF